MAFKTFISAQLPSSDVNTYLMKQVVNACTTGTLPASPSEGQPVYKTDTDAFELYTTATTGWRAPWNLPWGYIAQTTSTASTAGITAEQDVLTVTFTAVTNRRYKLTYIVHGLQATTTGAVVARITDNTPNGIQAAQLNAAPSDYFFLSQFVTVTPSAGSVTYRGRIGVNLGSLTLQGAPGPPAVVHVLLVEDVGPNGAPA